LKNSDSMLLSNNPNRNHPNYLKTSANILPNKRGTYQQNEMRAHQYLKGE